LRIEVSPKQSDGFEHKRNRLGQRQREQAIDRRLGSNRLVDHGANVFHQLKADPKGEGDRQHDVREEGRAIDAQPLSYLKYVGRDLVRVVDPSFPESPNPAVGNAGGGDGPAASVAEMFNPVRSPSNAKIVDTYYRSSALHAGNTSLIKSWERATRLEGPAMVVVLLLGLLAPFLTEGVPRRFSLMLMASSIVLIVGPILVADYDYRYAAPAFGALTGAAAIGGYELWRRLASRRRPNRVPS